MKLFSVDKEIRENPVFKYLFMLVITAMIGFQGWRTLFNNFGVEMAGVDGLKVGVIQAIREIPGFISFSVVFLLIIFKEFRLSALSVLIFGFGILLTGFFPSYVGLMITTFIMSLGFHFFEATNQSLTLQYFSKKETPVVMGFFKSMGAVGNIAIGAFIWGVSKFVEIDKVFLIIGIPIIVIAAFLIPKNIPPKNNIEQNKRLVFKKKYWLYYLLSFLSGARRQIFVVFAVFMLVKKYNFAVGEIAIIFIINNILNFFITPQIGKAINFFGEKKVLGLEYLSLTLVFLGYAFLEDKTAVTILYVLDHIFFGFSMGINTFFQKIAEPQDIAPSVSVAYTINHISAVIIPVVGGALWMLNWRIPFIAGAGLSIVSLISSRFIFAHNKA